MSAEKPEQLEQGTEEPALTFRLPKPPPWVRVLAALAVVLLAGGVLLRQRHEQGPVFHPSRTPGPSQSLTPGTASFAVSSTCPTEVGADTFTVAFTLTNITGSTVSVRSIAPTLPLGGLDLASTVVATGLCDRPGAAPADQLVASGRSLAVSFRFHLPTDCPAPYPVGARIDLTSPSGEARVETEPVLVDLGGIDFPNCP